MLASLVMTVMAPDRPGLVEALSSVIADHEGSWLESRMSRLGGQFAGILRIQLPSGRTARFLDCLRSLEGQGLKVVVHEDTRRGPVGGELRVLEVVGHDRPGIVRQISHALAQHGVNVEDLSSEVCSAAMSGELLFKARAKVLLPAGCNPEALQRDLERIASDLIVDLSFVKPTEG
ncbi:MAG: ACT domain-containing protein [Verrucomicrobia bacterium]|jgi:glycine cleavage system regulatory protein|nr:ACT domain-containing protein [Verrucomicrobiota bacterium]